MISQSGLAMYDALKSATADRGHGEQFGVNRIDSKDLGKLKTSDLMLRGYDRSVAERVSAALMCGDLGPLGESMGLRLTVDPDAPSLLAPA